MGETDAAKAMGTAAGCPAGLSVAASCPTEPLRLATDKASFIFLLTGSLQKADWRRF